MRAVFAGLAVLFFTGSLQATTTTVSTAAALTNAVYTAQAGDTILVANGTYNLAEYPAANVGLQITTPITLKSLNGAANVTLTSSLYIAVAVVSSNVTIDGFTINGASSFGIQVSGSSTVSNVILRNLNVAVTGSNGQGLAIGGTTNSLIELCTLTNTPFHAISLSSSNYNLIINNSIQTTGSGDGVALVMSDHNIISGNVISNTYFDGVTLNGSQYNYVGLNSITQPHNGVTVTNNSSPLRNSIGNYVGSNTMVLSPTNPPGGSDGIWFNYDSDYNMAFGNDASMSSENGMAVFNSVGNYIRGNVFHQNPQGGIFVAINNGSGTTPPAYNSLQQNYIYKNGANGGVTLDTAPNTDISFNYMAGDPAVTPTLGTPYGILLRTSVTNAAVHSNLILDLAGDQIYSSASGISLFLNRYLGSSIHYTQAGAGVQWDSGSTALGGNYFSDFTTANGNPSNGATPYTNIIDNLSPYDASMYKDRYPYASESLGRQYSMSPTLPSQGSMLPAGSLKTIAWNSQACVLVDINLVGGTTQAIVANAADYGYFRWTVPSVTPGPYTVQINCKDSSGTVHSSGTTSTFYITPPDLVLLSPQVNQIIDSPNNMMISWKKTANVTLPVSVYIRYATGNAFTLLQSNVTNDFVTVAAPAASSNQVSVMISAGSYSDSTDGAFTIRAVTTGAFTSPAPSSSNTLYEGSAYPIEWVSPQTTTYVTIDLIGSTTQNIATQLADFSKYLMLVPAMPGGAYLRLTFYSQSGTVLGTAQSSSFTIAVPPGQPALLPTLAAYAGTPQTALVNSTFATNLQAIVKDANSNPVAGVAVTFTAPGSGATGSFQGLSNCSSPCTIATVTTNSSGIAAAPSFLANGTSGAYVVTATSPAATGTSTFSLSNTAAIPTAVSVSVTPNSGGGASQVFTAVFTDTAGASAFNTRMVMINSSINGAGACLMLVTSSVIFLASDANSSWIGPATAGGNVANSQCTIIGSGSGVVNSGNTSTATLSLTFSGSFGGAKNIYMFASDTNGLSTAGWQTVGTFTVSAAAASPAVSVSMTPNSGGGASQVFTAVFSDTAGASALNTRMVMINSTINGTGSCLMLVTSSAIYLASDANSSWMGPATSGKNVSNSQCTVNGSGSGVINSGNNSTATISITFSGSFGGAKNIYMFANDTNGLSTAGWQTVGTFTVSAAATSPAVSVSMSPNAGAGTSQVFTAVFSDTAGASVLNTRMVMINSTFNGTGACLMLVTSSVIYLASDANSSWMGPASTGGNVSNSQCTINGTGSGVSNSGNNSTATISITFSGSFGGAKNIYMFANDTNGLSTGGWQTVGTFTVASATTPSVSVSISPTAGAGISQIFTAVFSDTTGASVLNTRMVMINSTFNGTGACLMLVTSSVIYLASDANSSWMGPASTGGNVSNSQCTINGTGSGVSNSGNNSTATISITFSSSFGGAKNIYMFANDTNGFSTGGWQTVGTFTP